MPLSRGSFRVFNQENNSYLQTNNTVTRKAGRIWGERRRWRCFWIPEPDYCRKKDEQNWEWSHWKVRSTWTSGALEYGRWGGEPPANWVSRLLKQSAHIPGSFSRTLQIIHLLFLKGQFWTSLVPAHFERDILCGNQSNNLGVQYLVMFTEGKPLAGEDLHSGVQWWASSLSCNFWDAWPWTGDHTFVGLSFAITNENTSSSFHLAGLFRRPQTLWKIH